MIFQKYEVKEKIKLMILTLVKIILKHLNWKDSKQKMEDFKKRSN